MAAAFPSVILGFLGNSLAHYLQRNLHISSQVKQANAGAFAALVSSIFRIPTMLLKNRMQIMTTKYIPSFIQLATHIIKTEGFFMLYKGIYLFIFIRILGRYTSICPWSSYVFSIFLHYKKELRE